MKPQPFLLCQKSAFTDPIISVKFMKYNTMVTLYQNTHVMIHIVSVKAQINKCYLYVYNIAKEFV